jgi:hypothetical protein
MCVERHAVGTRNGSARPDVPETFVKRSHINWFVANGPGKAEEEQGMTRSSDDGSDSEAETEHAERPARNRSAPVGTVIRTATEQLAQLLDQPAEAVSSCERQENGDWRLTVEVVELRRVPDTMSLLASYEVQADPEGQLLGYRRARRYERGRADRR